MANPTYTANTAAVTTTAAVACTLSSATTDGAMLQNVGSTTIYLGGSTVTATGATAAFPLAANASLWAARLPRLKAASCRCRERTQRGC
jgi:hypothetical protein